MKKKTKGKKTGKATPKSSAMPKKGKVGSLEQANSLDNLQIKKGKRK